jgi:hypothetical protein
MEGLAKPVASGDRPGSLVGGGSQIRRAFLHGCRRHVPSVRTQWRFAARSLGFVVARFECCRADLRRRFHGVVNAVNRWCANRHERRPVRRWACGSLMFCCSFPERPGRRCGYVGYERSAGAYAPAAGLRLDIPGALRLLPSRRVWSELVFKEMQCRDGVRVINRKAPR